MSTITSTVSFNPPHRSICGAVINVILILHMKELRSREVRMFTQAHIAGSVIRVRTRTQVFDFGYCGLPRLSCVCRGASQFSWKLVSCGQNISSPSHLTNQGYLA